MIKQIGENRTFVGYKISGYIDKETSKGVPFRFSLALFKIEIEYQWKSLSLDVNKFKSFEINFYTKNKGNLHLIIIRYTDKPEEDEYCTKSKWYFSSCIPSYYRKGYLFFKRIVQYKELKRRIKARDALL